MQADKVIANFLVTKTLPSVLISSLLRHMEFIPLFFCSLLIQEQKNMEKWLKGKECQGKNYYVNQNKPILTYFYVSYAQLPCSNYPRLFHWVWVVVYVTYQRGFIFICYHFHWPQVSWRSELRNLKGDASRFVWQNRLPHFLCAVWNMKPLGDKGIFFFWSMCIL